MADYTSTQFTCPQAVTHPSSNQAQCWLTMMIEAKALTTTLRQCINNKLSHSWTHDSWVRWLICRGRWTSLLENCDSERSQTSASWRASRRHETESYFLRGIDNPTPVTLSTHTGITTFTFTFSFPWLTWIPGIFIGQWLQLQHRLVTGSVV